MQALAMGGYGSYVWAAFGFTLASMLGLLWMSWRAQRRRDAELAALRSTVRGGRTRPRHSITATRPGAAGPGQATASHARPPAEGLAKGLAAGRPTPGS